MVVGGQWSVVGSINRIVPVALPITDHRPPTPCVPRPLPLVLLEVLLAPLGPADGELHGSARPFALGGVFGALVEGHDDVGAEADLRFGRAFGCEGVQ